MPEHLRFRGRIAGLGSSSGVRVVVGSWAESPFGAFSDVMLAEADGTRRLLAPSREVAEFVASTYVFDDVHVVPVDVRRDGSVVHVVAGDLDLTFETGDRTLLGRVLRLVPSALATTRWWSHVTDRAARLLLRGVRTRGTAGHDRSEVYGATDHQRVDRMHGRWRGHDLGSLTHVVPDPGFGFGSTPRRPSVTSVVTTVTHHP